MEQAQLVFFLGPNGGCFAPIDAIFPGVLHVRELPVTESHILDPLTKAELAALEKEL